MPLSTETCKILGCTVTAEELDEALTNGEWKQDYELSLKSMEERFKEFEEKTENNPQENAEVDPAYALSQIPVEERFRKYSRDLERSQRFIPQPSWPKRKM